MWGDLDVPQPHEALGVPSISILLRDPSFKETIKHLQEQPVFEKERWSKRIGNQLERQIDSV